MDFTNREQIIIQLIFTVLNPRIQSKPHEDKEQLLREFLRIKGIPFNEKELIEFIHAINKESHSLTRQVFGKLQSLGIDWRDVTLFPK